MWFREHASHRAVAALLLAVYSLSCSVTGWKSQEPAPEQVLAEKRPDHVRVLTSSGSRIELWNPRISGDTLAGSLSKVGPGETGTPGGVAVADVRELEIRGTRTDMVVLAAGLTALLVVAIIAYANTDFFDSGDGDAQEEPVYSCPLVYSWDGQGWRLDSGTFGGAIMQGLARTEVDNLVHLAAVNDSLRLRVSNELNETDYLDRIAVLAVDHDVGFSVAPDGTGRVHSVGSLTAPTMARDFRGHDARARIATADGWGWESSPAGRDSSRAAHVRDGIELRFPRPSGATQARLVVDASNTAWAEYMMGRFVGLHGSSTQEWYDSVAAYPELAAQLGRMMHREVHLGVWVHANGRWERRGTVGEAGPEVWKRQVVPLDLSGAVGEVVRVRLESAPSIWLIDHVAMDYSAPRALGIRELTPARAVDGKGANVLPLLTSADRRELVKHRGDTADLLFMDPSPTAGMTRSYLLAAHGWYRLHVPASGPPQTAVLERALIEPLAASRIVTGELMRAVRALDAR
jgi:hypothetical protein